MEQREVGTILERIDNIRAVLKELRKATDELEKCIDTKEKRISDLELKLSQHFDEHKTSRESSYKIIPIIISVLALLISIIKSYW